MENPISPHFSEYRIWYHGIVKKKVQTIRWIYELSFNWTVEQNSSKALHDAQDGGCEMLIQLLLETLKYSEWRYNVTFHPRLHLQAV